MGAKRPKSLVILKSIRGRREWTPCDPKVEISYAKIDENVLMFLLKTKAENNWIFSS